jgi:hypothetical protein
MATKKRSRKIADFKTSSNTKSKKSNLGKKAGAGKIPLKIVKGSQTIANEADEGDPGAVSIRMYCIGTGDCFVLKFYRQDRSAFTMMIDCGSCIGDKKWFTPYITDLAAYVKNKIDLLVVTHEHQDHVNGFQKCAEIFSTIIVKQAWFAWTEHPEDPDGEAAELQKKRKTIKSALGSAVSEIGRQERNVQQLISDSPFSFELRAARESFVQGLNSLASINLNEGMAITGEPLAGMKKIKEILEKQKTKIRYLNPGSTVRLDDLPGINFHILGPPKNREFIFKEGKQGSDVYHKSMSLDESTLAARAFQRFTDQSVKPDLPFRDEFTEGVVTSVQKGLYNDPDNVWRKIDNEWLMSAGTLALRLTSHINNTSLALAIESENSKKVILMPGDAEYGSWESWHMISFWNKKGKDGKIHFVEDLLSRTSFYKVAHHLSFNGTALEKGIAMMPESNLVAMATLDRDRISNRWKSTMPNKHLLSELIRRTGGRFFIMNESEIDGAPSLTLDPDTLGEAVYKSKQQTDHKAFLYKQYTFQFLN